MEWEDLIAVTHAEVDRDRVARGLPPWNWNSQMANRPVLEWCAACWVAGERSVATKHLGCGMDGKAVVKLPFCDICASVFANDPGGLEILRDRWEAMPDFADDDSRTLTKVIARTVLNDHAQSVNRLQKQPSVDRIITAAEIEQGLKLLASGSLMSQIAKRFNLPYGHVRHHLMKAQRDGVIEPDEPVDGTNKKMVVAGPQGPQQNYEVFDRQKATVLIRHSEHSVTHSQELTVSTEHQAKRRVTILVSDALPRTQVKLTPEIANAVWKSLTKEQRYDLLDIEDLWENGYDDEMRMYCVNKVLLIHPDDEAKKPDA